MSRLQRVLLIFLISLVFPAYLWAEQASEMITIGAAATGASPTLCSFGTPGLPAEHGLFIHVLDASIYYTIHSATATPSATVGGLASAGTIMLVDRASEFRAIRVTGDARAYLVCVPK